MIRGTTPTHVFTLQSIDTSVIKELVITYQQRGTTILEKRKVDCQLSGNKVTIKLTQRDTLKFTADRYVDIQIKVLTLGGDALVSSIRKTPVEDVLNEEVLS